MMHQNGKFEMVVTLIIKLSIISKFVIIHWLEANLKLNEVDAVIVGFNVSVDPEAEEIKGDVKIIADAVVYKLIEDLQEWRANKQAEIEREKM